MHFLVIVTPEAVRMCTLKVNFQTQKWKEKKKFLPADYEEYQLMEKQ